MIRPTSAWAHTREGNKPRARIRKRRGMRVFLGGRCKVESGRCKVEGVEDECAKNILKKPHLFSNIEV
jgi:hypothetical protein